MNTKSFLKGATIGVMLASVAALLLAPKSGKKTRSDVQKLVNGLLKKLHKDLETMKDISKERYEEIIAKTITEYSKGQELTQDYLDEMKKLFASKWIEIRKELKKK